MIKIANVLLKVLRSIMKWIKYFVMGPYMLADYLDTNAWDIAHDWNKKGLEWSNAWFLVKFITNLLFIFMIMEWLLLATGVIIGTLIVVSTIMTSG